MNGIQKRHGWYDDTKRIEVASIYAVTGDPKKCSELTGVPADTIRGWRSQDWFKTLLEEIRNENNEILDSRFTEIVHKSQDLVLDRLEHGDFTFSKTGELVRKPVSVRDLALVAAITVDKRQILRNKPTQITSNTSNGDLSDDKLVKLAAFFKQLTNKQEQLVPEPIEIEPEDVQFEEVLQDQEVQTEGNG